MKRRENVIVNRLNKTKVEKEVDFIAVRIERERERSKVKRQAANEQVSIRVVQDRTWPISMNSLLEKY